jgi:hypothetical protein
MQPSSRLIWDLRCWPSIYRQQQFRLRASKAQKPEWDRSFHTNTTNHFDRSPLGVLGAKVSFEVADFFEISVSDDQRFNLIYDYTRVQLSVALQLCDD